MRGDIAISHSTWDRLAADESQDGDRSFRSEIRQAPVFCMKCGRRLNISAVRVGFDPRTGHPKYELWLDCPRWRLLTGHARLNHDDMMDASIRKLIYENQLDQVVP